MPELKPLRIAALVKQIPKFENMTLGPDGRLQRDGLELHMNDYCRRAVAQGVALARVTGGTCTAITLGPPSADTVLREAILCGAVRGIHVTDVAFAGSDTLATARALAAALARVGPFDLILCGRNSIDADTGQVPPELAELLDLPFVTGVREVDLRGGALWARLEHDDEWVEVEVDLPAVVSCAERLIDPCKIKDPSAWASVEAALIDTVTAADLGAGPWGQAGSPTWVGRTRAIEVTRARRIAQSVPEAVAMLDERGVLEYESPPATPPLPITGGRRDVVVLVEPDRSRATRDLLGAAASVASAVGASVCAVGPAPGDPRELGSWGADRVVTIEGAGVEEDVAAASAAWISGRDVWAVLGPSSAWGREVASRVAARLGAGLTGDAVELEVDGDRLVAWKPAFGGALVAAVGCTSPVQLVTVRAGVLPSFAARATSAPALETVTAMSQGRVRVLGRQRDDDSDELAAASMVIGVGMGVDPADYPLIESLAEQLGATLCATRKVTDKGWMPRARQVGITGHAISPKLYISIGISGKFNHTAGIRSAGTVVGVNVDPEAEIFRWSDVGIVGDWRVVLPELVSRILVSPVR